MKFLRIFGVAAQRSVELFWQSNKQPWLQIDNALKITLRCNKHPSKRKIQEPYFGSWNILHPLSSAAEAPFFVSLALNAILLGYPAGPLREPVPGSQIVGKTRKSPQFPPALFHVRAFSIPMDPTISEPETGYLCGLESLTPQKVVNAKELHGPAN